jgi:hypothetical protein
MLPTSRNRKGGGSCLVLSSGNVDEVRMFLKDYGHTN